MFLSDDGTKHCCSLNCDTKVDTSGMKSYFSSMSEVTRIQHTRTLLFSAILPRTKGVDPESGKIKKVKHDYQIMRVSICLNLLSSTLGVCRTVIQDQVKCI